MKDLKAYSASSGHTTNSLNHMS